MVSAIPRKRANGPLRKWRAASPVAECRARGEGTFPQSLMQREHVHRDGNRDDPHHVDEDHRNSPGDRCSRHTVSGDEIEIQREVEHERCRVAQQLDTGASRHHEHEPTRSRDRVHELPDCENDGYRDATFERGPEQPEERASEHDEYHRGRTRGGRSSSSPPRMHVEERIELAPPVKVGHAGRERKADRSDHGRHHDGQACGNLIQTNGGGRQYDAEEDRVGPQQPRGRELRPPADDREGEEPTRLVAGPLLIPSDKPAEGDRRQDGRGHIRDRQRRDGAVQTEANGQ